MRLLFFTFSVFASSLLFAQDQDEKKNTSYFDFNYFKGNIALHNTDIQHLITGHPEGFIIGWNKKTYGHNEWEQLYNYPDYGVSFNYQDMKNEHLGKMYGFFGHYNFYFFKRNMMLRIGQGFAYTTNPYHKDKNYRNIAFGSSILSSTYLMLNYKKENIFKRFGLQAGFTFVHYSNANVKAPNTSTNTIAVNVGVNYNLDEEQPDYIHSLVKEKFTEPVRFNFVFRTGINESDIIDSGQYAFYVFSAYADKRISKKSAFQIGTDVFYSNFLKEYIKYKSISYPEENITGNEDYKRVGIFAGHELFVNKFTVLFQYGYYVHYPVEFEGRTYLRAGLQYYFNDNIFSALTLKSHGAKAEAVEFGIGYRL